MTTLPRSAFPFLACSLVACSSSSSPTSTDAGAHHDTGTSSTQTSKGSSSTTKADAGAGDAGGPSTTIADVRQNSPMGSFAIEGFVTALAGGMAGDFPNWYIEDPKGGPNSGIDIYCDPAYSCTVPEPVLGDLILVTGALDSFDGQVEVKPTAMKVLQSNATAPPIAMLTTADVAPSGNSPYRGSFVAITIPSKLTVDSVTPSALANTSTSCGATFPSDGGARDAGRGDAGPADAGGPPAPPACKYKCSPPVYSGFRVNDGAGNEIYVQAPFYSTDPLESSPECLTGTGVVPVTVGMTFSKLSGILDVDPHSGLQAISPVVPADYTTP